MVCNHKVGKDGDNFIVRLSGSDGYLVTECDGVTPTPSPSPSLSATPPPPTPTPTPSTSSPPLIEITESGWYCHWGVECPEPWCGYYEIGSVGSYCNISGPFATEAECVASCAANGTVTPTGTPTATPTGTPGSTPTPTP